MTTRARAAATAAALAAVCTVPACGVEGQREPEPVPVERLPNASARPDSAAGTQRAQIWGVRDERLVPVLVELSDTSLRARLAALLALSDPGQQVPTALPRSTQVLGVQRDGDAVVVLLSSDVREVPVADLPLVLGQIVFTVTEQPGPVRVRVRAGDDSLPYVTATGRTIDRALVRADFAGLLLSQPDD